MALLVFLPDKQIATNLLRPRGIPSCEAIGLLAEPGMSGCNRTVHRTANLRRGEKDVLRADELELLPPHRNRGSTAWPDHHSKKKEPRNPPWPSQFFNWNCLSSFAADPNGPNWYTAAPVGEKGNTSNGSAIMLSR